MLKEVMVWLRTRVTKDRIQVKLEREEALRIWKKMDEIQERERLGVQVFRGEYVKALKDAKDLLTPLYDKSEAQERTLMEVAMDNLIARAASGNINGNFAVNFDVMKSFVHEAMGNIRRDGIL